MFNPKSFFKDQNFQYQCHVDDEMMIKPLAEQFFQRLRFLPSNKEIVLICIGTDRSTGDSFGPLTGTMVDENSPNRLIVYGTLSKPVHALNLNETLHQINASHHQPFIVAMDASMGKPQNIGRITFASGPVRPGSAVKKSLPDTGDMHITGTVNVGGMMEFFVLQNTRLHLVMRMAERTAEALLQADRWLRKPPQAMASRRRPMTQPAAREMSAPSKE
ncbi:putative sporulation protein YyaC [Geomicrobium halophilum]|uniref:Putative sporulation protein YyaC n=1 Tax=Geomicrobium halophilum TaxID=549000 RepID=A0A841Q0B2_9BACL|nr:spore protease YyaC [Geomicrobium halophilum]MBB6450585.1 putative sporulation protein YyaC [Geomicrobium halophilum]